jgi:citrate synthase
VAPGKARSSALSAALLALSRRLDHDLPSRGRARALLVSEAMGLVGEVIDAMLGPAHKPGQALHKRMARSWGAPCAEDILRRALVLLADHELNASTFATRVAASTGTPLAAALLAGLATLAGPLHAGATVGAQALIEAARRIGAAGAVREHLAQGQPLACFGHPLYPEGDPRAAALFAHFTPNAIYTQVLEEVGAQIGELPNIDFALCALSDRYGLPGAAPFIIFALARCVGWIAHALEQVETGQLIRPRARYVGPAPDGADAAVEPAMSGPRRGAGPGAWSG